MKLAKTPTIVHAATNMMSIQMLSWIAGQWYLCTRWRSYTYELVTVDAMVADGCRPSVVWQSLQSVSCAAL